MNDVRHPCDRNRSSVSRSNDMDSGNVISLFGSNSTRWPKNSEQVRDCDEVAEDHKLALEIWMPGDRKLVSKIASLPTGTIRKNDLARLMDSYRASGNELIHAFIGSRCQIMRFFVELEEDEDDIEAD